MSQRVLFVICELHLFERELLAHPVFARFGRFGVDVPRARFEFLLGLSDHHPLGAHILVAVFVDRNNVEKDGVVGVDF